jgi:predicted nucleic acid-binding protein
MRVLLDTNVIIDAFTSREPWRVDAERIILLASEDKLETVICASSVTDIFYICNKVFRDNNRTREVIKILFNIFTVTDVKKKDLEEALSSEVNDFEDALVSSCAKRTKSQYIVTRNIKDFDKSLVPAITPKEFLTIIDK